jgi:hypothetical protein
METTKTDCRTEEGIIVGLIDSIIAISRVLRPKLNQAHLRTHAVNAAIRDWQNDGDFKASYHGLTDDMIVVNQRNTVKKESSYNEVNYKEGTILTNGKQFIYLGYVLKKDWTPANNYGRKRNEYWGCACYPAVESNGTHSGEIHVYSSRADKDGCGEVPGLWLQPTYGLADFKPIKRALIHPTILKKLIS